jgi:hypothetical protein
LLNLSCTQTESGAIWFQQVNNSVVRDCLFNFIGEGFSGGEEISITDSGSTTGNTYINDQVVAQTSNPYISPVEIQGAGIAKNLNVTYTLNIAPVKQ